MEGRSMEQTYYIDFDTESNPGKLEAVKVTIGVETISDMQRPLRIDLASHPLYPDLVRYVDANRPGRTTRKR